ncbi:MAG TPA: pilus assembly protein PilM [Spirochaetota bacterium]|nr:pilus assembly protein PilM [Spirochaetota bacterium]OPZ37239.1 MAG: Competence protein A [Spirochaetes bacterium ADurb.BinA120]HNU90860.1 pilus assembly protein PilM [Spirochaetota bacterium]HPI14956.1 pilus assembly protein PilM [Spirochaetota bacterium]HPO44342.1 pilus assembly protein PilM [Spirochaetota bacterium]
MFENITALDIGSSSVRMLTARTGLRNFQVTGLSIEDVIPEEGDSPTEAVRRAIERLLADSDPGNRTILCNLPMERAIVRNIAFPFSDVEKISAAIPYEAEENLPFSIDELIMDFQALKSPRTEEARIMLAATPIEAVREHVTILADSGLRPIRMGLEANALFECYRYFNRIPGENIIQVDIGHEKTVLNVVGEGELLYTRCISLGLGTVHREIASINHTGMREARLLFESLNLDLTSIENNYQRDFHKTLGLTRPRLKKIYDRTVSLVEELVEQILLTLRAFTVEYGALEFGRILISGGGANLAGIGHLLSRELELPVASLPFLQGYPEQAIQTQFPIVFGTMLSYLNSRRQAVNFLKGEFVPDLAGGSRRIYYLAALFLGLAGILLLANLAVSSFLGYRTGAQYQREINERYMRYFHARQPAEDPIKAAAAMLNEEKKQLDTIDALVQPGDRVIDLMTDITEKFPGDPDFQLSNMVVNEGIVRIDGQVSSSRIIDDFKNRLLETGKFGSVDLNTNISRKNEIGFSLVIKQSGKKTPPKERME